MKLRVPSDNHGDRGAYIRSRSRQRVQSGDRRSRQGLCPKLADLAVSKFVKLEP